MHYKEYAPHQSLQEHVKCFWIMERTYTPEHPAEDVSELFGWFLVLPSSSRRSVTDLSLLNSGLP